MLSKEFLQELEQGLVLEEDGSSEAYFPAWGYTDPDVFVQECDAARARRAQERAQAEAAEREALAAQERAAAALAVEQTLQQQKEAQDHAYMEQMLVQLETRAALAGATAAREYSQAEARAAEEVAKENTAAVQQAQAAAVPVGMRVVWGAGYWLRRVLVVVLACVLLSVLVTLVMNPGLTFSELTLMFETAAGKFFASARG